MNPNPHSTTAVNTTVATINIDLSTPFGTRYVSNGDDGEYQPVTLGTALLDRLESKLVEEFTEEARKMLREALAAQIKDTAAEIVASAVNTPIRKTNSWGEATGPETTVRELVSNEVKTWLTSVTSNSYDRAGTTNMRSLVTAAVTNVMASEMKATIDKAKTEVYAAVQAKGAEVLAETLRRAVS